MRAKDFPLRFMKGGNLLDINWLWQASLCQFPLDVTTFGSQNTLFYAVATDVDSGKATMPDTTTGGAVLATPAAAAAVANPSSFAMSHPPRNDKARTRRARYEKGQGHGDSGHL